MTLFAPSLPLYGAMMRSEAPECGSTDCPEAAVILDLGLSDRDDQMVLADLRQWSRVPVIVLTVCRGEAGKPSNA